MNDTDFHDCMVNNREIYAREQAKLDHIYEQERAKYSNSKPTFSSAKSTNFNNVPSQANNNIEQRLNRIEARIDKLYEMFGNRRDMDTCNGLFVFAPSGATVNATSAFTLTDEQFKMLMSQLKDV